MRRALALWLLSASGCICEPGSAACGGRCVELRDDVEHCGGCGHSCGLGQLCIDGECRGDDLTSRACSEDADCDDRIGCDGVERCVNGACRTSEPIDCDDGVACTREECREPGFCVSIPDDARCSGSDRCTAGAGPNGCTP